MRNNFLKKNIFLSIISISQHLTHSKFWFNCVHLFFSSSLYLFYSRIPFPLSIFLSSSLSRIYVIIYIHILYTIIYIQRIFIRDLTTNVALKTQRKRRKRGQIMYAYKKIIIPIFPLTYIRTYACIYTYWYICMCVNVCVYIYYIYMIFSFVGMIDLMKIVDRIWRLFVTSCNFANLYNNFSEYLLSRA